MEEKDKAPLIAGSPPKDLKDWVAPTIIINGITLSIEEYTKDPKAFNSVPIEPDYLDYLCQSSSLKVRNHISNLSKKEKSK